VAGPLPVDIWVEPKVHCTGVVTGAAKVFAGADNRATTPMLIAKATCRNKRVIKSPNSPKKGARQMRGTGTEALPYTPRRRGRNDNL